MEIKKNDKIDKIDKINKMEKNIIHKLLKVKYLFEIPDNKNMKILFEKNYQEEPFQKELNERSRLFKDIEKQPNKEKINYYLNLKLKLYSENLYKFIFKKFTNNEDFKLISYNDLNNLKFNEYNKYDNIYHTGMSDIYNKQTKNIKKYGLDMVKHIIKFILFIYNHLNTNGSCCFKISLPTINIINILYFLNLIFDKVYIINKHIVFCKGFMNDIKYIKIIKEIEEHNYEFNIKIKKKEKEMIKYFKKLIKIDYFYKKKMIYDNNFDMYIYYRFFNNMYNLKVLDYLNLNNYKKYLKDLYFKTIKNFNSKTINDENIINKNNNIFINEIKKN